MLLKFVYMHSLNIRCAPMTGYNINDKKFADKLKNDDR